MIATPTLTYLERTIVAAAAGCLVLALWPRAEAAEAPLPPATITIAEPAIAPPESPVVMRLEVPPAPPSRALDLVFTAGGASWIKLADLDVLPRHGKAVLADDDYVTSAIAKMADADVPEAHRDWLGKRVTVDGTCTARVVGFAVISRLTGYPAYAGVESDSDTWTAATAMEHGTKLLAAKLDNCAGGTFARDAQLSPVIIPEQITDAPLADAAVRLVKASQEAKAGQAEWKEFNQPGRWVDNESTDTQTQVLRHPLTGETWVSVHLRYAGGCGLPNVSAWGLFRADADGRLIKVTSALGDLTEIEKLLDIDGDGDLEVIGHPWLGTQRVIQARDGSTLDALALPYFFCPC